MKRLIIITHEFYPILCGGSVFIDKLSQSLASMDYEIEVLTCGVGSGFPLNEKLGAINIRRFYTARKSKSDARFIEHIFFFLLGFPQMLWYLLKKRQTGRFFLFFGVFVIPSGMIAVILGKLFRTSSVVFVDAADTPGVQSAMKNTMDKLEPLFKWVTHQANGITICDGLQDIAIPMIENSNIAAIPNGTVLPSEMASPGTQPDDCIRLLSVGRLVFRKGFKEIIEALALVREKTPNFHLTLVGYGRGEEELLQVLDEKKIHANITMTGRVEYEQLKEFYLNSDCYLFYGDREGSSLAMIEAVAYGLPVIATDHPGNTTYVHDHANGLLVEHKNAEKLRDAILEIIRRKSDLPAWGKKSREIALQYTWDRVAGLYDESFRTAAQPKQIEQRH